ncbi:MAG: hypothetical protein ACLQBX_06455 [Candidatus Limnocylindrales bacterium]|jgi:hypothetical protein
MELNHPPPIQRTLRILYTARHRGFDLKLTQEDQTYVDWVGDAFILLQALADVWWSGINPDLRMLFVDGDDAPSFVLLNTMFPGIRVPHPPALRGAAAKVGLADRELAALVRAAHAAQLTPSFEAALAVARQVRSKDRGRLAAERARIVSEFSRASIDSLDAERIRLRHVVDSAYEGTDAGVRRFAMRMRAYNGLVTACLAFLLGYLETDTKLQPLSIEEEHPITGDVARRSFHIHLTFTASEHLGGEEPFMIRDGGPLDGLYIQVGAGFQLQGQSLIVDRHGLRMRELEAA